MTFRAALAQLAAAYRSAVRRGDRRTASLALAAYRKVYSEYAHAVAKAKALKKPPVVNPVDSAVASIDKTAIGAAAAALGVPQLAPVAQSVAAALDQVPGGSFLVDPLTAQVKLAAAALSALSGGSSNAAIDAEQQQNAAIDAQLAAIYGSAGAAAAASGQNAVQIAGQTRTRNVQ